MGHRAPTLGRRGATPREASPHVVPSWGLARERRRARGWRGKAGGRAGWRGTPAGRGLGGGADVDYVAGAYFDGGAGWGADYQAAGLVYVDRLASQGPAARKLDGHGAAEGRAEG